MNTIRLNTIGTPFPKAEGGGGDTPSEGGVKYYDISALATNPKAILYKASSYAKVETEVSGNTTVIIGVSMLSLDTFLANNDSVVGVGIDWEASFVQLVGQDTFNMTMRDYLEQTQGLTEEVLLTMVSEITEEEFYNTTA